ncbi:hypothetical protein [Bifidobacterium sp.]|jgi:hypothetical protein|uniref:hypothetical protein n=1 Tax=Bifidobacterium sp. TaxID=41200 RepID=UPI0025C24A20|nr:hypothetical protein [Bifidobacterium sp.]MCH4209887.1 hypothetical protein [Bifidobacterium sp.]MCI1225536.1 hypothetical protein [Bifidobacterium sp.]
MAQDDKRSEDAQGYRFTDEQREAIATLAATNVYARQSKWKTFRELPKRDKWPFFVQHFLLGTVAVAVALAIVIAMAVTFFTKPPDPLVSVQGVNMPGYSAQLAELNAGFRRQLDISDKRLVQIDDSLSVGENGDADDSAKIMTMVSAGQITMLFAAPKDFATLAERGYISKPVDALTARQMRRFSGALVDAHGQHVADPAEAVGLDLSQSRTWAACGLPNGTILGFSNMTSGKDYPRRFVEYLRFA